MINRLKALAYRLLRRGEKYTGTDNVYLAKGGFWLTTMQLLGSAASLGLAILFGRFVTKADYGTYQYLLSWGSILAIASLTGLGSAVAQATARGLDRTIFLVLKARLRGWLIGFAIALAFGTFEITRGRVEIGLGLMVVGCLMPLTSVLAAWSDYVIGRRRFDLQSKLFSTATFAMVLVMSLTIILVPRPLALVSAYSLIWTLTQGISLAYVIKRYPPTGGADPEAVPYGVKLTGLDLLSNIANYIDRLLVFTFLGAQPTAAYAFAIAPVEQVKGYLKNLAILAMPKIAARPLTEIRRTFHRKFWLMLGIVALGIVTYIALAPIAYHWLFPKYPEAIRLSQIYALGLLGTAVILPSALFEGHKRIKENTAFQVGTNILNIVSLCIFIPTLGLLGAVLARVVTRLAGVVYGLVLTQKIFREEEK